VGNTHSYLHFLSPLPSHHLPPLLISSQHHTSTIPIFILYLSVLTYTYLYSINISPNLTPHVLSEWMVEV
jgi:hypothetical protein